MLTTHYLQDIETLAKRIVVINHGTVCFDGGMEALSEKYAGGSHSISFTLQEDVETVVLPEKIRECVTMKKDGRHVTIAHPSDISSSDILSSIFAKYAVSDISIKGPQIEDVVMEVYNS